MKEKLKRKMKVFCFFKNSFKLNFTNYNIFEILINITLFIIFKKL